MHCSPKNQSEEKREIHTNVKLKEKKKKPCRYPYRDDVSKHLRREDAAAEELKTEAEDAPMVLKSCAFTALTSLSLTEEE